MKKEESNTVEIIDTKYKKIDINEVMTKETHLDDVQKEIIKKILEQKKDT